MIPDRLKTFGLIFIIISVVVTVLLITSILNPSSNIEPIAPAPDFKTRDTDNNNISLQDNEGKIVLLNFVYLTPGTCVHCRAVNAAQISELHKFASNSSNKDVVIITIDMTYDPSGNDARAEKERYNITWPVINDAFSGNNTNRKFKETNIGGKYIKYLMDETNGQMINPTMILLNKDLDIVGVYHVGQIPMGFDYDASELTKEDKENLLTEPEMADRVERINNNAWGSTIEGKIFAGVSLGSMFILGISISITPCALAILISVTSYVASLNKKKKEEVKKGKKKKKSAIFDDKPDSDVWFGTSVALAFILGIGGIFFIIGCLFTYVGFFIKNANIFYIFAGAVMILFGIQNLIGWGNIWNKMKNLRPREIDLDDDSVPKPGYFERARQGILAQMDKNVLLGAFLLGVFLAIGWAPCALTYVFPVLILIMTQQVPVLIGGLYLFVFSIGYGVPVLLLVILTTTVKFKIAQKAANIGKWIPKVFGVLIILMGILMILRWFGLTLW